MSEDYVNSYNIISKDGKPIQMQEERNIYVL
jgi:hypothetical protein